LPDCWPSLKSTQKKVHTLRTQTNYFDFFLDSKKNIFAVRISVFCDDDGKAGAHEHRYLGEGGLISTGYYSSEA